MKDFRFHGRGGRLTTKSCEVIRDKDVVTELTALLRNLCLQERERENKSWSRGGDKRKTAL